MPMVHLRVYGLTLVIFGVNFRSFGLTFGILGSSLGSFWGSLASFLEPLGYQSAEHVDLQDIAKTYENLLFFFS